MKRSGFSRPLYVRPALVPPKRICAGSTGPATLHAVAKTVEHRNPWLLKMARGKPCLLQIPLVCKDERATVVAAHSNQSIHGKGMSRKADDQYTVWACSACHRFLDQGNASQRINEGFFMRAHLDQVLEWRRIVVDMSYTPRDRKAAHWALCLLEASPTGETP